MSQDLKRAREIAAQIVTEIKVELDSPALDLARWLQAIADHLHANPQLTRVNACSGTKKLQVASYTFKGEPDGAAALILWHDSLIDPQITASAWPREQEQAKCMVTGRTASGVELIVWDVVDQLAARLGLDEDSHAEVPVMPDLLRELAAGTVKSFEPASQDILDELDRPAPLRDEPCPYTHSHTRHFCGRVSCRES